MKFEVQTRTVEGELGYFDTLKEAFKYSEQNEDVWKISFPLPTGERVRLVMNDENLWFYEDIITEVKKKLQDGTAEWHTHKEVFGDE